MFLAAIEVVEVFRSMSVDPSQKFGDIGLSWGIGSVIRERNPNPNPDGWLEDVSCIVYKARVAILGNVGATSLRSSRIDEGEWEWPLAAFVGSINRSPAPIPKPNKNALLRSSAMQLMTS